jgi:hypothetical protein
MKCPYINPTIAQCENCPLPDCFNDELSYDEMISQNKVDQEIKYELPDGHKKKARKARGYDKRYYEKHKTKILAKAKAEPEKHRKASNKYYSSHTEQERQRNKEKHINNREKRLKQMGAYNKVYYARLKERQAG